MANFIAGPWYNALKIPPEKVEKLGLKLLLDPSVKGKIAWHDPSVQGAGQPYTLLLRAKLGDDGLKQVIVEQKTQFFQDQFQVVEAMARGTAWIGIGPPVRSLIAPYTQAGVKTDIRTFGTYARIWRCKRSAAPGSSSSRTGRIPMRRASSSTGC